MKPLIFVHPLSDTLKKLQEVIQETAEAEGIELYEIDDIGEFNQLFPTIGQSVAIFADPKKCAKGLQANKKVIQKIHSKVILLSSKPIPRKTLEKFDKVGLTESIIEPVIPKTLLYKVKLHLRSIISKAEQEEETKHFSKTDEKNNQEDGNDDSKTFSKSSNKPEEEQLDYYKRDSSKSRESNDSDARENSYHEEGIDKHWKGKNKTLDDSVWEDDKKEKKHYQEETIDGFYKGKVKKDDLTFEEETKKKKNQSEAYLDDEINDIKKSLMLEIEDDIQSSKPKIHLEDDQAEIRKPKNIQAELDNEERSNKPAKEQEVIDSYMRGQSSTDVQEQEDNKAHDSTRDHLKTDLMKGEISDLYQDDLDENEISKNSLSMDLEFEKEEKKKRELGEDIDNMMSHDGQVINPEDNGPLSDIKSRKSENIEKYIKGSLSHLQENMDDPDIIDNETDLTIEPFEDSKRLQKNTNIEEDLIDNDKSPESALDIEDDTQSSKAKINTLTEEDHAKAKSAAKKEKAQKEDLSRDSGVDKINDQEASKSNYEEGDLKDQYTSKSENPLQDTEGAGHLSGEGQVQDETEKKKHTADNRADKIQKYYKGKGNSHQQQGWGNLHKPSEVQMEDFESQKEEETSHPEEEWEKDGSELQYGSEQKKQSAGEFVQNNKEKGNSGELIYAENDLGEQTIDYKKLKEEFEAIPYDLKEKNKYGDYDPTKKTSGYDVNLSGLNGSEAGVIEGGSEGSSSSGSTEFNDPFLKDLPPDLIAQKLEEKEREESESQEDNESSLIVPRPQGLDEVILLTQMYENIEDNFRSRLNFIAQSIFQNHKGRVVFYLKKPGTDFYEEVFISHFDLAGASVDEFQIQSWTSLKEIKFPFWLQMTLPTWSDSSFQDKDCDLFFPFTENHIKLGFAVVHFYEGFNPEHSPILEVLLDAARGIFMEPHQATIIQKPDNTKKDDGGSASKGLFGKFFKDKAS